MQSGFLMPMEKKYFYIFAELLEKLTFEAVSS